MLIKDIAICIRAIDSSETSQIVTFFTKDQGKISVIAKGSKREKSAFDGTIEMFSNGSVVFTDPARGHLGTLTEFDQQPFFTNLSTDFFKLNCSLFAAELIDKFTDDCDPHPELFDLLGTHHAALHAVLGGQAASGPDLCLVSRGERHEKPAGDQRPLARRPVRAPHQGLSWPSL